jgi:hypothetical protein
MTFKYLKQLIVETFKHPLSDSVIVQNEKGEEITLREGGKFQRVDLSGANLAGTNLAGIDLSEANLSRANLAGADLRKAQLRGANLQGAIITGTKMDATVRIPESNSPARLSVKHSVENPSGRFVFQLKKRGK